MVSKFQVSILPKYCKGCGICVSVCPKKVLASGKDGKVQAVHPDLCIGCLNCEYHCPDFAITVAEGGKNGK
ncbi:MAG: 4Fe-4S binding protein [Eubacteriales bacterium]|jgi:2-oxoglutarate ferredoxin oxidoreductase subunit delta|nr:4Fe-4S binding protein [Eubacteriales bacterium]